MVVDVFEKLFKCIGDKIDKINAGDSNLFELNARDKIIRVNKWRFSSDVVLPIDKLIEFHSLTIVVSAVIEKGGKFYPEIYVDEGIYEVE